MIEEGVVPKASQLFLMAVALVAFARPLVALAGPVTDADLRGKTICWSYGGTRNTYGKDGSLDSNLVGHGTWSLVGDRITEHGDHGVFSFTIDFTCMGGVQAAAGWTSPGATANEPPPAESSWRPCVSGRGKGASHMLWHVRE